MANPEIQTIIVQVETAAEALHQAWKLQIPATWSSTSTFDGKTAQKLTILTDIPYRTIVQLCDCESCTKDREKRKSAEVTP